MIDKVSIDMCCLCGNCVNKCPKDAISFSKEENLFLYPAIDKDKCISCDICEKVCPALNVPEQTKLIKACAAKNKDEEILKSSTSGGVFSALSQAVILNDGIVYGAAFTDGFRVKHIAVDNVDDLALLRGSKYVQSDLGNSFSDIEEHLKNGREVLFSGCPCQTAALNSYLKNKKYDGILFMVDFICHGILSQNLFNEYISYLEKKKKSKITQFSFRKKVNDWNDSGPEIVYKTGKITFWPLYEDIYMQGYFQSLCMRENCYSCKYKNFHSGSDVTIGDFWGAKQLLFDFYDAMGVSALTIQTDNGVALLKRAKKYLELKDVSVDLILKHNKGLLNPFNKGPKSNKFFKLADKIGHMNALVKITKVSKIEKVKRFYRKIRSKFMVN